MITDINELAARVHKANEKWWQHPVTKERIERNKGELLMLVITELAEACEGERKNLMDDKLPHRKMAEVEMADAYIRLLDFAAGFNLNLTKVSVCYGTDNKGQFLLCISKSICNCMFEDGSLSEHFVTKSLALIEDYCVNFKYDLMGAFEEKMAYNATRADHKHKARLQADGKKW